MKGYGRASASFRDDEVEWLDQLLRILRRSGGREDVAVLARQPQATTIAAKVEVMRRAIVRQKRRLS